MKKNSLSKHVRRVIRNFENAVACHEWKGAQPPEDRYVLEEDLRSAREALETLLEKMEMEIAKGEPT